MEGKHNIKHIPRSTVFLPLHTFHIELTGIWKWMAGEVVSWARCLCSQAVIFVYKRL